MELLSNCKIKPFVNQIELHPFCLQPQKPVIQFCQQNGIEVQAYSPLGTGQTILLQNGTVTQIAKQVNKSSAQVLLRWALQHNFHFVVKSATPTRIEENLDIFDFELSTEHMQMLDDLEDKVGSHRFCWNSDAIR